MISGIFTKHYGDKTIFDNFHFSVEEGVTTSITSPSGRGKTTLLRLLSSLEENENKEKNDFLSKRYSYLFQEDRLCPTLSGVENITLCKAESISDDEIIEAMHFLSLSSPEQKVSEYSGGMKRRVAILRALYAPYDILLLDEPFKGLDEALLEKTANFTRKMSEGKTVILVTHEERDIKLLNSKNIVRL